MQEAEEQRSDPHEMGCLLCLLLVNFTHLYPFSPVIATFPLGANKNSLQPNYNCRCWSAVHPIKKIIYHPAMYRTVTTGWASLFLNLNESFPESVIWSVALTNIRTPPASAPCLLINNSFYVTLVGWMPSLFYPTQTLRILQATWHCYCWVQPIGNLKGWNMVSPHVTF